LFPVANFNSNVTSGYVPLSVQFNDSSENATNLSWDFGDAVNSTEKNPIHTYSTPGNYTVNLTASNAKGTNSKLATINILRLTPTITWSNPADIIYDTPLSSTQLNASASVPGNFIYTPALGTVLSAGTQTLHVDFTPTDTVDYTTSSKDVTINISEKSVLPVANFSNNVSNGTVLFSVQFTDLSQNSTSWKWNFGDSTNSTQQNPIHTYSAAGNYTINLTATNGNGTDSKLATITVLEKSVLPLVDRFPFAYIPNFASNTISVINTTTNNITTTVPVGVGPVGVTVTPDGKTVYVTNQWNGTVSVIDTATNNVTKTVKVGTYPFGISVTPDGKTVYVANYWSNTVSVIDTATNNVTKTVNVGFNPRGIAVTPDGKTVYVANYWSNTVSVIDTATNNVTATVNVGSYPVGVAVTPDGKKVYVANTNSNDISVIDTATNTVTDTVNVGKSPWEIVFTPGGTKAYITNTNSKNVSVIATATNNVIDTINLGASPYGVAVTPDGKKVYVAN
jgi:YVTN family beta-propeller protein